MNSTKFLGQYIPQNSLIHFLNPIIKIMVFVAVLSIVFTIKKAVVLIIVTAFIFLLMHLTKIRIFEYIRINRIFILFAAVISISNFMINHCSNSENFAYTDAFESSFTVFIRLFLLAMINSVFLFTTSFDSIITSIEFMLYPLKYFKINIREISLTSTVAIKFLPIIFMETEKIIMTQKSRGADFKTKNLFKKIKNYVYVIPPLIVFSLKKVNNMSSAMFSRCYSLDSPRTKFKKIKIKKYDIIFLALSIITIIGVIICNNMIN